MTTERVWLNSTLAPDERARLLEQALTEDERYSLLHGICAVPLVPHWVMPPDVIYGSGHIPGIPRLGVPPLRENDAHLGVSNWGGFRKEPEVTALPSHLALGATWNSGLARAAGALVGNETARIGYNVLLAGAMNLIRDPRCGRTFEYLSEDPLLTGILAAESVRGVQSEHVVSTVKHFALNDQETGRYVVNAQIEEAAFRESDLLVFELAIERGQPGAVMSAYNKVNGVYAAESSFLLKEVLKGDWAYPGWVMSDWGATPSVVAAAAGLDQQSGEQIDYRVWFGAPLREAVDRGEIPAARISDMVRRILRSMFACGLFDQPSRQGQPIDYAAHAKVTRNIAEEGAVLLRNERTILPLRSDTRRILVVGGQADVGVLSGGGSSQVTAGKGHAAALRVGGEGMFGGSLSYEAYHPSSPLEAIRRRFPNAEVRFVNGRYPSQAAMVAKEVDVAIVFATQWMTEAVDVPDLSLPNGQDALIAAVAAANPNTVVVLETGGPVSMPWLDDVAAVLEAWYPGGQGGEAIAAILSGDVNPSGRLPVTFPRSVDQLPRPAIGGYGKHWASIGGPQVDITRAESFDVPHVEGADVGYRWFARTGKTPLFPLGFGLSYTSFRYADLEISGSETPTVSFTVQNIGDRAGAETPQIYLKARAGESCLRLLGWSKLSLEPGAKARVNVTADKRLLADFDAGRRGWYVPAGLYEVFVGPSSASQALQGGCLLRESLLPADHHKARLNNISKGAGSGDPLQPN